MAMIGNCPSTQRQPLVMAATENLSMQISDLNDQVTILIHRLSIVSRCAPPCDESKKESPIKESTPLSDTLDGYSARIFAMRNNVIDAIDRLEI